jgi:hypothetical protein
MRERHGSPRGSLTRLSTQAALTARCDRRLHRRVASCAVLFVRSPAIAPVCAEAGILKTEALDLSRGGLRVRTAQPLPRGTEVEVWIRLSGAPHPFYLLGEVRWCSGECAPFGLGIAVHDAPSTDFGVWRRLVLAGRRHARPLAVI